MLIDKSYFDSEKRNIPNTDQPDVLSLLNNLIAVREREYLIGALGYDLFKAFTAGIAALNPAQKYLDILLGIEFTAWNGRLKRWDGLISIPVDTLEVTVPLNTDSPDLFFTVGELGAPADMDVAYVNTSLKGANFRIFQRALGPLEPLKSNNSNIATADIQINPTGGFTWLNGIRFYSGDKYHIELLSSSLDVSAYPGSTIPESPIADYVFYWYLVGKVNHVSGTGQVEAKNQNSIIVSSAHQQVQAWNNMVDKTRMLKEFLRVNYETYPEYQSYEWDFFNDWRYLAGPGQSANFNSRINVFGI